MISRIFRFDHTAPRCIGEGKKTIALIQSCTVGAVFAVAIVPAQPCKPGGKNHTHHLLWSKGRESAFSFVDKPTKVIGCNRFSWG